ncbi:CHAP domain-containing protein (plasmid) [Prescottella defluvii]|nr:CHAP domain-containing protein [Prescottella defluvii]
MVKVNDVVSYVNGLVGKGVDADGWYGTQCMDLTVDVMQRFFGWRPYGNAIALVDQPLPAGFQRIRTTSSTQIKAGDVLVWGLGYYAQYGHTAIATEDGRADGTFVSVDQNWNNPSLEVGSPAAPIHHNMDGVFGVIRPLTRLMLSLLQHLHQNQINQI